jgi:hypothetical protein
MLEIVLRIAGGSSLEQEQQLHCTNVHQSVITGQHPMEM